MANKHFEDEEHKSEAAGMMRWLLTYADLVTLLLACFIVIAGSRQESAAKFTIIAAQAQRIFGGGQKIVQQNPPGTLLPQGKGLNPFARGGQKQQPSGKPGETLPPGVKVMHTEIGQLLSGLSDMMFDSGSAGLKGDYKKEMTDSTAFKDFLKKIEQGCLVVKGHTDDRPIATAQFPSNWELSGARASEIAKFLISDFGVDAKKVTIVGKGDTEPVADNATEEGRQQNRRVEMWVLNAGACNVLVKMQETSRNAGKSTVGTMGEKGL